MLGKAKINLAQRSLIRIFDSVLNTHARQSPNKFGTALAYPYFCITQTVFMSDDQLKHRTAKGLIWGGIGNGTMQILNLLFGIFLARLLSPADYGTIGALTIFSATAGIFSESGFTLAIVNKKRITDNDYNAVFWFNVCASAVLYLILFFLATPIAHFYRMPEMIPLSRFLFLGFMFGGLATTPTAYFFRNLKVKERSQIQIAAILISGTAGVICAFYGWGYWGLALQTVLYSGTNALLLWLRCPWRPSLSFDFTALKSMLPFSTKQLLTSLFTHINNNFFSVLLGRFYGMQQTGYFTQGNKWTTMGYSTLVGMINSVGQPVFRETIDDTERLRRVFHKMLRFTAFVSFPAMLGLGIISRELIVITITDKWINAVPVMHILCVWGAFMPIGVLYGNLFNSLGRPNIYMWNTITLGAIQLVSLLVSYRFGLNVMLIAYTTINILWLLVWQYFARKHIGVTLWSVIKDIAPYAVIAAAIMGIAVMVTASIESPVVSMVIKIAFAASFYILVLWRLNSVVFNECINFLLKRKK